MYGKKPAVIAATTLAVLGGGSAAAFAAGSGSSSSSATTKAPTVEIPVKGASGTGSLSITGIKGKTFSSSDAKVQCAALGNEYVVYERVKGADGKKGAMMRIVVDDYNGPGNYQALVSVGHRRGDHKGTKGAKAHAGRRGDHFGKGVMEPVTITSTGGSTSFTRTLTGTKDSANAGKTITVKADWTCTV